MDKEVSIMSTNSGSPIGSTNLRSVDIVVITLCEIFFGMTPGFADGENKICCFSHGKVDNWPLPRQYQMLCIRRNETTS